ncbi:hypothetical protein LINPERPRIM_LOCUS40971, partial [Linum perenne]
LSLFLTSFPLLQTKDVGGEHLSHRRPIISPPLPLCYKDQPHTHSKQLNGEAKNPISDPLARRDDGGGGFKTDAVVLHTLFLSRQSRRWETPHVSKKKGKIWQFLDMILFDFVFFLFKIARF